MLVFSIFSYLFYKPEITSTEVQEVLFITYFFKYTFIVFI